LIGAQTGTRATAAKRRSADHPQDAVRPSVSFRKGKESRVNGDYRHYRLLQQKAIYCYQWELWLGRGAEGNFVFILETSFWDLIEKNIG